MYKLNETITEDKRKLRKLQYHRGRRCSFRKTLESTQNPFQTYIINHFQRVNTYKVPFKFFIFWLDEVSILIQFPFTGKRNEHISNAR